MHFSLRYLALCALAVAAIHGLPAGIACGKRPRRQPAARGTDVYMSATKLLLAQRILLNATVRATKANQNGLLGFGSTDRNNYRLMPEASVAMLLRKDLAVGVEYRAKPDNLAFAGAAFREDGWRDVFVVYTPSKRFSLTAAAVNLGNIVGNPRQTGVYLSGQLSY